MEAELGILGREAATGLDHKTRVAEITEKLEQEKKNLASLEKHWSEEKELVSKILDLRSKLRAGGIAPDEALRAGPSSSRAAVPAASPAGVSPAELKPAERDKLLIELKQL